MLVSVTFMAENASPCKPEPKPERYQDIVDYEDDAKQQYISELEVIKKYLPYLEALHTKSLLLALMHPALLIMWKL